MDYFSEPDDRHVTTRAIEVIERSVHDVIVVYQQDYDDTLHRTTPFSREGLRAVEYHVDSFGAIAMALRAHWRRYAYALAMTPDHGAHVDPASVVDEVVDANRAVVDDLGRSRNRVRKRR